MDNHIDLVFVVVQGDDEPQLSAWDVQRCQLAESEAKLFLRSKPGKQDKQDASSFNVRLAFDLADYLDAVSRDRDNRSLRKLLSEPSTIEAFSILGEPVIELIQRIAKGGHLSAALSDLETFLDRLIDVLDGCRSRIQDQQKSIQAIDMTLAKHQKKIYSFLHKVHTQDSWVLITPSTRYLQLTYECDNSIIEEFLASIGYVFFRAFLAISTNTAYSSCLSTFTSFLKYGAPTPIVLSALLPLSTAGRRRTIEEVEDLVTYAKRKALKRYAQLAKRDLRVDDDDPVMVEGDGRGQSSTSAVFETKPRPIS